MWKIYGKETAVRNRTNRRSLMICAFACSMLMSLLCFVFYNAWVYQVERTKHEEGSWHVRIQETLSPDQLEKLKDFAHIADVEQIPSKRTSNVTTQLTFDAPSHVYSMMPSVIHELKLNGNQVDYHETLLSLYFANNPDDSSPPMLLGLYVSILIVVMISLILVLRNAFALNMNARIRQLGILSSIGATPGQIRISLIEEALVLCALPVAAGTALGVGLSAICVYATEAMIGSVANRIPAHFSFSFTLLAGILLLNALTVFFSVLQPVLILSKKSPLECIRLQESPAAQRKLNAPLLERMFGIEGEIAGTSLKSRRKSMRLANLSLLFSVLGFSCMLCFVTLSKISTDLTYFQRYQNAWDVMESLPGTPIQSFKLTDEMQNLPGISSAVIYQNADVQTKLEIDQLSSELQDLGGFTYFQDGELQENWLESQVQILDDASFAELAKANDLNPDLNSALILNRIWNSQISNFRDPEYVPFLRSDTFPASIRTAGGADTGSVITLPVAGAVKNVPLLREEYGKKELIYFVPVSLWETLVGQNPPDLDVMNPTQIRLLADDERNEQTLQDLQQAADSLLQGSYPFVSENRIQEKQENDQMIEGFVLILAAFCTLIAVVGLANIFSTTLGFVYARKKEFAQYQSVGMTATQMKKIFRIEALCIIAKPLLISIPLILLFIQFALEASYLEPSIFWRQAPIGWILLFVSAIALAVSLAYWIGSRSLLNSNLSEALADKTL